MSEITPLEDVLDELRRLQRDNQLPRITLLQLVERHPGVELHTVGYAGARAWAEALGVAAGPARALARRDSWVKYTARGVVLGWPVTVVVRADMPLAVRLHEDDPDDIDGANHLLDAVEALEWSASLAARQRPARPCLRTSCDDGYTGREERFTAPDLGTHRMQLGALESDGTHGGMCSCAGLVSGDVLAEDLAHEVSGAAELILSYKDRDRGAW